MPSSRASAWSSQSSFRSHVWQSPSCSESRSSTTVLRASRTRPVFVRIFMPSATGMTQEAARSRAPSISTRHTRQAPMAWTFSR